MWRKEAIPQEFKAALIFHLFKRKENPQLCDTRRGISLLAIAGALLNRLKNTLNSQGFYQKATVDSERTEEQLT